MSGLREWKKRHARTRKDAQGRAVARKESGRKALDEFEIVTEGTKKTAARSSGSPTTREQRQQKCGERSVTLRDAKQVQLSTTSGLAFRLIGASPVVLASEFAEPSVNTDELMAQWGEDVG